MNRRSRAQSLAALIVLDSSWRQGIIISTVTAVIANAATPATPKADTIVKKPRRPLDLIFIVIFSNKPS